MTDHLKKYIQIDKRIDAAEEQAGVWIGESLRDRWEFGKLMLSESKGQEQDELCIAVQSFHRDGKFAPRCKLANAVGNLPSRWQVSRPGVGSHRTYRPGPSINPIRAASERRHRRWSRKSTSLSRPNTIFKKEPMTAADPDSFAAEAISEIPLSDSPLAALRACRNGLLAAVLDAARAADMIDGARASRGRELVGMVDAAIAHCDRLLAVVEDDERQRNTLSHNNNKGD